MVVSADLAAIMPAFHLLVVLLPLRAGLEQLEGPAVPPAKVGR
jgi:hypothetical protein